MNPVFRIVALLVFVCVSCKKEDKIPMTQNTSAFLKPHDYYPAYPGSYWQYLNEYNDTVLVETATDLHLDSYNRQSFFVPHISDQNVWGASIHFRDKMYRFLADSLAVGVSWVYSTYDRYSQNTFSRRVIAKDTGIVIFNNIFYPTLVVEEYISNLAGQPITRRMYYTKNIGLVKEERVDLFNSTIIKQILRYHIAR